MRLSDLLRALLPIAVLSAASAAAQQPQVIAHRGASGYLPEHTLAAYALAIEQGADIIEPDLVFTKDGVLVARHEHFLSKTTDVAEQARFAGRKRILNGRSDWFTEDFTLAEIRTLRTKQAFAGRDDAADGKHSVPTFQEIIDLVRAKQAAGHGPIGLYPETKSPGHFAELGFDFAKVLGAQLEANNLPGAGVPVWVQSFEPDVLRRLNATTDLQLVQLVRPRSRLQPNLPNIPLEEVAQFADGVGAMKYLLLTRSGEDSGFVAAAQSLGLFVHVWTFRDDSVASGFETAQQELDRFIALGIDGFFTDFPDTGVEAVRRYKAGDPH